MLPFRLHPDAQEEALAAVEYIKADDPVEGTLFVRALEDALSWARKNPLIFRCFDGDFRRVRVGKFRYSLIFRLVDEEIQVLAVMHTSRRPGYWKRRDKGWRQ